MQITLIQNSADLGNFSYNINKLNSEIETYSHSLCLTSSFALLGNPCQTLDIVGGFQNRIKDLALNITDKATCLIQNILEKPHWIYKNNGQQSIFEEDYFEIENINFFAPHNCKLDYLASIKIPQKTQIIYLASAEEFYEGKDTEAVLKKYAKLWNLPIVYLNALGASDGIVYPGQSMLVSKNGEVLAKLNAFKEDSFSFEFDGNNIICQPKISPDLDKDEYLFKAACLAIKEYARKCGIKKAVVGISGGMDSALISVLACEALGAENVTGLMMPSKFSSEHSLTDAKELVQNLNIAWRIIPIQNMLDSFESGLKPVLDSLPPLADDLTFDNLQARIRGNILMAYANRANAMVLGTGNKSEIAMGYCTLYGDTVGAMEPIGDIYKTRVYSIAKWYNRSKVIIPENILTKAPSAELRPNQKDEDSLPAYDLLDEFLYQVIEMNLDPNSVYVQGLSNEDVDNILNRLKLSEFKRQQSPFSVLLSCKSFGHHWTLPISAKSF